MIIPFCLLSSAQIIFLPASQLRYKLNVPEWRYKTALMITCYQIYLKVYSWKYWNRQVILTAKIIDTKFNITDLDYKIGGLQDKQARVSNEILNDCFFLLFLKEFQIFKYNQTLPAFIFRLLFMNKVIPRN